MWNEKVHCKNIIEKNRSFGLAAVDRANKNRIQRNLLIAGHLLCANLQSVRKMNMVNPFRHCSPFSLQAVTVINGGLVMQRYNRLKSKSKSKLESKKM